MCLAIYKPAGKAVPEDHLEEGFQGNPDGAGFAYVQDGHVRYVKGFFDYETFLAHYKERVKDEYPAVIHFRWATVGAKTSDNCHPFVVGNGGVLVHNGPQIQKLGNQDRSDSRVFAEEILAPFSLEMVKAAKPVLEGYLDYNKVVLLYPNDVVILNEKLGTWEDGIWYSNDGYRSWYSTGSWNSYRYSGMQRSKEEEEEPGDDAYGEAMPVPEEGEEAVAFLTDEEITAMLDALPHYMLDYVKKNTDLDNHFFDPGSGRWFFYDHTYQEYVDLETGYAIDEYYSEILKQDFPGYEDGEAPIEGPLDALSDIDDPETRAMVSAILKEQAIH